MLRLLLLFAVVTLNAQEAQYSYSNIPRVLKSTANSVVQDESIVIDVTNPKELIYKHRRVVTVLSKTGNDDVEAFAQYDNNSKVKNIEAYIYDAFGNEIEHLKKRDFLDVSASGNSTLYSDSRLLYMNYTPIRYPYTVVFEKEIISGSSAFIPSWYPLSGYYSSTAKSVFRIDYDPKNKLSYKAYNFKGYTIGVQEKTGSTTWTATNLQSIIKEDLAPGIWNIAPVLRASTETFYLEGVAGTAKSWKDFGLWMNNSLIKESDDLSEESKRFIRELIDNEEDDMAKAKKIYEFVQSKVRYISVQVEIGGWKPMLASDVDELSYGDCKALTNYTKTLMEAAGVPSYYTIIQSGESQQDIDKDLVAIQGNHVILGVGPQEDITWLECTSTEKPFGYMGTFTDNRDVIMITDDGGVAKRTTKYTLEDNLSESKSLVTVNLDGTLDGQLTKTSEGIFYSDLIGISSLTEKDQREYHMNYWSHLNKFTISDLNIKNDKDNIQYTQTIAFSLYNYAQQMGNDYVLKPNLFSELSEAMPTRYPKRLYPFIIERDKQYRQEITYILPEGYTVNTLPDTVNENTPFGTYQLEFKKTEGNKLIYNRHLVFKEGTFEASAYKSFRSFYKTIIRYDNQKLLLEKQ